jgi:hypothetical protein
MRKFETPEIEIIDLDDKQLTICTTSGGYVESPGPVG